MQQITYTFWELLHKESKIILRWHTYYLDIFCDETKIFNHYASLYKAL